VFSHSARFGGVYFASLSPRLPKLLGTSARLLMTSAPLPRTLWAYATNRAFASGIAAWTIGKSNGSHQFRECSGSRPVSAVCFL